MKRIFSSIFLIFALNFLSIGSSSYAIDLTDKEPPSLQSIKIISGGSTSDLYVLEIVTKDDKNWVYFEDKSFRFSYLDDPPVCNFNYANIWYSVDEVSRETNSTGTKIQKFYLSFLAPLIGSNPNCPKPSISKFEFRGFRDRDSNAFISIRDAAGRSSQIPIISKVLESPFVLNKDFFQRFTMSNFGVWLCVGDLSGTPLTSRQNATNDRIKSYNQFISLLDSYSEISGNSDLIFSRKIFDQGSNQEYVVTWDQSRMRQELIKVLDDNLRLRDFQNSKSLTDLLKLRVCAPVSEKEWLDERINIFMMAAWGLEFQGQPGFVGEITTQIRKAETKVAAEKAAAELKAKQEAEVKVAAELKAKQEAEVKAAALAAANKKTTIICVKGKLTKKVSAAKPKCPAGYKVRK
jgi:hypothetical protein